MKVTKSLFLYIILVTLMILIFSFISVDLVKADYDTETKTFRVEGDSPRIIYDYIIPNLFEIVGIKVDNGFIESYETSGDKLSVILNGGDVSYKNINITRTGTTKNSAPNCGIFNVTEYYNSGGYLGTLNKSGDCNFNFVSGLAPDSFYVEGRDSQYYNSNGYSGTLSQYLYSGSYTPSDSKFVTGQTSSYYNSGGYSGNLTAYNVTKPGTWRYVGHVSSIVDPKSTSTRREECQRFTYYENYVEGHACEVYVLDGGGVEVFYQGTVTKPESDTRIYRYQGNVTKPALDTRVYKYRGYVYRPDSRVYDYTQQYSGIVYKNGYITNKKYWYDVTVTYIDNIPPVIDVDDNISIYSEQESFNKIRVSGNIKDRENGLSAIKYEIDNKKGILLTNVKNGKWEGYIDVDSNILEGNRVLKISANDGKPKNSQSSIINKTIRIDKTPPVINYTLSSNDWVNDFIEISNFATDNMSGVKELTQNLRIDDNGTYEIKSTDNVGNSSSIDVHINNIDKEAPTIKVINNTNSQYLKEHNIKISVNDTRGGLLEPDKLGSGVKTVYYYWSDLDNFDFNIEKMTKAEDNNFEIKTPKDKTGDYYLYLTSVDNVGNRRDILYEKVFKIDNEIDSVGQMTVTLPNPGEISINVKGALDYKSGLDVNKAFKFFLKDTKGKVHESPLTTNDYTFKMLSGNEDYEVSYQVTDKASNILETSDKKLVTTKSFNSESSSLLNVSEYTLNLDVKDNIKNLYGNTSKGSLFKIILKDKVGNVTNVRDYDYSINNIYFEDLNSNTYYNVYSEVKNNKLNITDGYFIIGGYYTLSSIPDLVLKDATVNSHILNIKTDNPEGTRYLVQRSENVNFSSFVTLNNWSTSNIVNSNGLSSGKDYYYRIKSRNDENKESEWSYLFNFKTLSLAPNLIVNVGNHKTGINTTEMLLTWNSVVGAEKYYIYRDNKKIVELDSSITNYTDTLDSFNKSYSYKIVAWNGLGKDADDNDYYDKGFGSFSNIVNKYTRAYDALSVELSSMTGKNAYFDIENSNLNDKIPNYRLIVKEKNKTPIVTSSNWSTKIKDAELNNLNYGIPYELWIEVRNEDLVSNNMIKFIDEFWMNRAPEINAYLEDYHTSKYKEGNVTLNTPNISTEGYVDKKDYAIYSDIEGYNYIRLRGEFKDLDYIPTVEPLELHYTVKTENGDTVKGLDNVRLADLGEIIGSTDGNWTTLKYNNNLGNYLGLTLPRFDSSVGAYINKNYSYGDYIDIFIIDKLPEGRYTLEVRLTDDQGDYDVENLKFMVDKTYSNKGDLNLYGEYYGSSMDILNSEFDIAGKDRKPFYLEVKENNESEFNKLFDYQESNKFTHDLNTETQSNTKFTYRAHLKDKAGNVYKTNVVEYISAVKLKNSKGNNFNPDTPNNIEIEWEKELNESDGLIIEIYRNNYLIDIVKEGNIYIDKNLDYEREYIYKLIVVGKDINGNRLESNAVESKFITGSPVLIVDGDSKMYKTLFSNYSKTNFTVEFNQGGSVLIDYEDLKGNISKSFNLMPKIKNNLEFELSVAKSQAISFTFRLEGNNVQRTVTKSVNVEEISPIVKSIKPEDYVKKYKTN